MATSRTMTLTTTTTTTRTTTYAADYDLEDLHRVVDFTEEVAVGSSIPAAPTDRDESLVVVADDVAKRGNDSVGNDPGEHEPLPVTPCAAAHTAPAAATHASHAVPAIHTADAIHVHAAPAVY